MPTEPSPCSLYVDDSRWVVIWVDTDQLVFVDPGGKDTGRIRLRNQAIPAKEFKENSLATTAGPVWGRTYCLPYFVTYHNKAYFCLRTWWDRRILCDMKLGRAIPVDASIEPQLRQAEVDFVLDTMRGVTNILNDLELKSPWDIDGIDDIGCATLLAGRLGVKEVVPQLRKIEALAFRASSVSPSEKEVKTADQYLHEAVRLSLRRLGEIPLGYIISNFEDPDHRKPWLPEPLQTPREKHIHLLTTAMNRGEVHKLLGPPDSPIRNNPWQYSIQTTNAFILLLYWDDTDIWKLKAIQRKSSAAWHMSLQHDRRIALRWCW